MADAADFEARDRYLDLMIEAKARALSINSLTNDQRDIPSPLVREYGVLQIRMLCEIIGLCCLVAHGDLVAQGPANLRKAYAPGEIFANFKNAVLLIIKNLINKLNLTHKSA